MKILGLDSSGIVASVAVVEDEILTAEYTVNYKKTHSQTLLPMLDEVAKMTELDLDTVDAIAVAGGPGSFTGLRIGSATAKGLGLALKKPLISVPTVEALAYNLYDTQGLICPIMDARRNQVYTGIYRFKDHRLQTVEDQMAVPIEELLAKLEQYGERVTFLGDGVPVFRKLIQELSALHRLMQTDRGRQQWHLWALYITKKENMEPQRSMCRTTFAFLRRKESGQNGKKRKIRRLHNDIS